MRKSITHPPNSRVWLTWHFKFKSDLNFIATYLFLTLLHTSAYFIGLQLSAPSLIIYQNSSHPPIWKIWHQYWLYICCTLLIFIPTSSTSLYFSISTWLLTVPLFPLLNWLNFSWLRQKTLCGQGLNEQARRRWTMQFNCNYSYTDHGFVWWWLLSKTSCGIVNPNLGHYQDFFALHFIF